MGHLSSSGTPLGVYHEGETLPFRASLMSLLSLKSLNSRAALARQRASPVRAPRLQTGASNAQPPVTGNNKKIPLPREGARGWAQFIIHHSSFIIGVSALLLCASLHPESNPTSLPQPPHHTAFAPQPKLTSPQNPMGFTLKPNGFSFETQWVWF